MKTLELIPLHIIDLAKQKIVRRIKAELEICEECCRYFLIYEAIEPPGDDEEMYKDESSWELRKYYSDITISRKHLIGSELAWSNESSCYVVRLHTNMGTLNAYYKKEDKEQAIDLKAKLNNYIFNTQEE